VQDAVLAQIVELVDLQMADSSVELKVVLASW
jgi:hypothetical protein